MKKTNRQLVFGSLQPFLFCVGMYCVVLIFSVFICSSVYRAMNPKKFPSITEKAGQTAAPSGTTAMVATIK
jgi:nitrate reductase gamma subunit